MIQPSCTKPRKFSALNSCLIEIRRNLSNQANNLSTSHRRLYLGSFLLSCVCFALVDRLGAISSRPNCFSISASSLSLSYALSPISRSGSSSMKRCSTVSTASCDSCRSPLAIPAAIGRPLRSDIAMILVALPRLVTPTKGPPFLSPHACRRCKLRLNRAFHGPSSPGPEHVVCERASHHHSILGTYGGRFGRADSGWVSPSMGRPCEVSTKHLPRPLLCP